MMDTDLMHICNMYNNSQIDYQIRKLSIRYLKKNWLHITLLNNYWLPIKNSIFKPGSKDLPEQMFNEDFELIAQKAGILFTKEEYSSLQKCMKIAGDQHFVIIENRTKKNTITDYHPLRFVFSIDTTWEELNNDDDHSYNDISSYDLILNPQKHFFVFGDSGKWGKYTANDYNDTPLDIIGFKPGLAPVFREQFKQTKDEREEIRNWLPQEYKKLIK